MTGRTRGKAEESDDVDVPDFSLLDVVPKTEGVVSIWIPQSIQITMLAIFLWEDIHSVARRPQTFAIADQEKPDTA
jgi:hypothetical protein